MEKFDINYWADLQGIHNSLLMNSLPNIHSWETDEEYAIVRVMDMIVVDKIPRSLFGLPTKIILIKETYRDKTEIVVKINTIPWKDKFEFILVDISTWMISVISKMPR
jgi:hypothetical protein